MSPLSLLSNLSPSIGNCARIFTVVFLALYPSFVSSVDARLPVAREAKRTSVGLASFYSDFFQGRRTAGGERFDNHKMVAAHPSYPLGTIVRVTNVRKARSVIVRICDRGPSVRNQKQGVIIDLSKAAASKLKMREAGRAKVRVDVLAWGDDYKKPLLAQG